MKFGGLTLAQAATARLLPSQMSGQMPSPNPKDSNTLPEGKADYTLRIAPVTVELSPERILSTVGYNGVSPGPLLRMNEGIPVTVDVINNTDVPELVHLHGLLVPAEVDGVEEEATPVVPPHGRRRYQFTPRPPARAGTTPTPCRWTICIAAASPASSGFWLSIGQRSRPVRSGELPGPARLGALLHQQHGGQRRSGRPERSQPEKPAVLDTEPNGLEVTSNIYSINDKALGAGEPIRVKAGQRVLFHFLNASAIENRHLALPGHKFNVIALDGNPVPMPARSRRLCWVRASASTLGRDEPAREFGSWARPRTRCAKAASASSSNTPTSTAAPVDCAAQPTLGLYDLRQAAVAAGPHRAALDMIFEKVPARRRQIQQLHGKRQTLSSRTGVRAQAGHALPADVSQPHRRRASAAPASSPTRNRRDLWQRPPA